MVIKKIYLILFFVVFGSTFLYLRSYGDGIYDNWNNFFVRCADMGQYYLEVEKYRTEHIFLREIMMANKEPGFLINASNLGRITNLHSSTLIIIICGLINILSSLQLFTIAKKISKSNLLGLIVVIIFNSIFLNNVGLRILLPRQQISTFFILALSSLWLQGGNKKDLKTCIIGGILIAASIISHIFGAIMIIGCFALLIAKALINKKKINQYILTLSLVIIILMPYILAQYSFLEAQFNWFFLKQADGFNSNLSLARRSSMTGYSLFENKGGITDLPLLHYLKHQSFIIIICIFGLNKLFISKVPKIYYGTLLFLVIYGLFLTPFGIRGLITTELFLMVLAGLGVFSTKAKMYRILIIISILVYNLSTIAGPVIAGGRSQHLERDPGLIYLKEFKNKEAFLLGNNCVTDFGAQMGFLTSHNFPETSMSNFQKDKIEEKVDFFTNLVMVSLLSDNLAFEGYLHNYLAGKELYLVLLLKKNKESLEKIKNYKEKPYLDLIYENKDYNKFISHIFRVRNENIQYFDNWNYLRKSNNIK